MHRILLYALVVGLLYLAWDARRGEVLASGKQYVGMGPAALVAQAEPTAPAINNAPDATLVETKLVSASLDPNLQARLDARVEAQPDVWAQFEAETPAGPPAEKVLADAEAWMEANFPEGGSTDKRATTEGLDKRLLAAREGMDAPMSRDARDGEESTRNAAGESSDKNAEPAPIYVASLARIESLGGDLPSWCGLLDLALQPAGGRPFMDSEEGDAVLAGGDTAWICDDHGRVVARVEALDGYGLELDSSWPWTARERRLFWNDTGAGGLPARYFRLVLEGNGFVPSWSGRLMLLHSRPPPRAAHR